MVALKTHKKLQHVSIHFLEHPQGARKFLVKVTDYNCNKSNFFLVMRQHIVGRVCVHSYINCTNILPIMIINRIYETQNLTFMVPCIVNVFLQV
jgi:hypothetical protein